MQDSYTPAVSIPGYDLTALFPKIWAWILHLLPILGTLFKEFVSMLVVISIPASIFFLIGIVYTVEQLKKIKKLEAAKYDAPKIEPAFEDAAGQGNKDLAIRWQKAQALLNSQNPNDWKQAILEADTMLLDVLTGLGYQGDGIGEKLKRVQPGEFKHIQEAWDAHKVRNDIAHTPNYALDHHTAVQTLHRFRDVFKEFYYI